MRWIFLTLVLCNLGLAGWQLAIYQGWTAGKQAKTPELAYLPTPGAATIKLLSEVSEPAPSEQIPWGEAPTNVTPEASANGAATPAAEALPPAAAAPTPANDVPAPGAAPANPPAAADERKMCLMYGPYEKMDEAKAVIERLAAAEIKSQIYEIEIQLNSNFQVYLAPLENRTQAKAKLEQLQAKGIDSFIIPKGELNNGIALGSFDNERAAREQVQLLLQQGIEAKIRDSKRPAKETWVALAPDAQDQLAAELKANLLKTKLVEERQILCTAIARQ